MVEVERRRSEPAISVVGRLAELAALRAGLSDARRGAPAFAAISGPAGIGKTSLLRQLADEARSAGATVLRGAALEGLELPHLLLATALRGVPAAADALDAGALTTVEDHAITHRSRLFRDVTDALAEAARLRPVVLVLDDLQWADAASVELLTHIVASLLLTPEGDRCGIFVVLAHRPLGGGILDRLVRRLSRHPRGIEVSLRPFTLAEAHAFVEHSIGAPPTATLLEQLREASGGNPLVLGGILERQRRAGSLRVRDGRLRLVEGRTLGHAHTDLDLDAHERLAALDVGTAEILALAAMLGPAFSPRVLAGCAASEGLAAGVEGALADAAANGILGVSEEGAHVFELDEVRRLLLAQGVARFGKSSHTAIAQLLIERDAQPAEVLHHLVLAEPRDEAQMREWARLAGDDAFAVAAWHQALQAYEHLVRGGTDDIDVLLRAGLSARFAGDVEAAMRHLGAAAQRARAHGDLPREVTAAIAQVRTTFIAGTGADIAAGALRSLVTPDVPAAARARALAASADLAYGRGDLSESVELAQAAVALCRGADDQAAAEAHFSLGVAQLATLELSAARGNLKASAEAAWRSGDEHLRLTAQSRSLLADLLTGELLKRGTTPSAIVQEMESCGYWSDAQVARCAEQATMVLRGRMREAEDLAAATELTFGWSPYAYTLWLLVPVQACTRALRGDASGARRATDRLALGGGRGGWRVRQAVDVLSGRVEEVGAELARRPWPSPQSTPDLFGLASVAMQLEVGAATGTDIRLRECVEVVRTAFDRGVQHVAGWPASTSRLVGQGLRALGDLGLAERWLLLAVDGATDVGAHAEAARALLELGLVQQRSGAGSATKTLGEAAVALDELGMLPLAAAARLAASSRRDPRWTGRRRVIFCSDLVGSTALNVRLGDEAWASVVVEHDRIVRSCFVAHDGVEFKHAGDGFFAWFANADEAVACALEVHDQLERWSSVHADQPLATRIGLAEGTPVDVGGDLFGVAVVAAARLCAEARTGGVLVAEEVATWAAGTATFTSAGERLLKGLPGLRRTFHAVPVGAK